MPEMTKSEAFFEAEIQAGNFTVKGSEIHYTNGDKNLRWNYEKLKRKTRHTPRIYFRRGKANRYAVTFGRLVIRITTGVWPDPKKEFVHPSPMGLWLAPRKHNTKRGL